MLKIPHRKEFEDLYREAFKKQVKQDYLDDPSLNELSTKWPRNSWSTRPTFKYRKRA